MQAGEPATAAADNLADGNANGTAAEAVHGTSDGKEKKGWSLEDDEDDSDEEDGKAGGAGMTADDTLDAFMDDQQAPMPLMLPPTRSAQKGAASGSGIGGGAALPSSTIGGGTIGASTGGGMGAPKRRWGDAGAGASTPMLLGGGPNAGTGKQAAGSRWGNKAAVAGGCMGVRVCMRHHVFKAAGAGGCM